MNQMVSQSKITDFIRVYRTFSAVGGFRLSPAVCFFHILASCLLRRSGNPAHLPWTRSQPVAAVGKALRSVTGPGQRSAIRHNLQCGKQRGQHGEFRSARRVRKAPLAVLFRRHIYSESCRELSRQILTSSFFN